MKLEAIKLQDIPPSREGWVYLIHAVGTNRYKVGRSVNPIARLEVLKGQSPYPLQVVWTEWTIDAIEDEKRAHKALAGFRVHGEWFEFHETFKPCTETFCSVEGAKITLEHGSVMHQLKEEGHSICSQMLEIDETQEISRSGCDISWVYFLVKSTTEVNQVRWFIHETLPQLFKEHCKESESSRDEQDAFLSGAIRSFVLVALGRELKYEF